MRHAGYGMRFHQCGLWGKPGPCIWSLLAWGGQLQTHEKGNGICSGSCCFRCLKDKSLDCASRRSFWKRMFLLLTPLGVGLCCLVAGGVRPTSSAVAEMRGLSVQESVFYVSDSEHRYMMRDFTVPRNAEESAKAILFRQCPGSKGWSSSACPDGLYFNNVGASEAFLVINKVVGIRGLSVTEVTTLSPIQLLLLRAEHLGKDPFLEVSSDLGEPRTGQQSGEDVGRWGMNPIFGIVL